MNKLNTIDPAQMPVDFGMAESAFLVLALVSGLCACGLLIEAFAKGIEWYRNAKMRVVMAEQRLERTRETLKIAENKRRRR